MFDHCDTVVGLSEEIGYGFLASGESRDIEADQRVAYEVTCRELADGWVDDDRHLLHHNLETLPLDFLGLIVRSVDRSRMNGFDLVRLMEAEARLESSFAAGKAASVAEIAFCPPGNADSPVERSPNEIEYAAAEIAAALTLTRRSSEVLLDQALTLTGKLGRVWSCFASGELSSLKVREFVRILSHLAPDVVDRVLDRILDEAAELTSGQLRARLGRLVMAADPTGVEHGMAEGLEDRKLVAYPNPDLTGSLAILSGHPDRIAEASAYVDGLARLQKSVDSETRTLDQLRHDIALDLLSGKTIYGDRPPSGAGGGVHMVVSLETLAGLVDRPGEMAGYGPIVADIARRVALRQVDGDWTWRLTHQDRVLTTGTTRYRPMAGQKRRARAEYETCVQPGCRMPATNCDLDHRDPYSQGGRTHNDNLAPLCRYHHMMRHHTPWEYQRLPNGDHRWTSPLGHTYVRRRGPPEAR